MIVKPATLDDCLAIAELGLIAGDGIPGYFWADSQQPGQSLAEAGAVLVSSESANFSYRNTQIAWLDGRIAGMILAYRLPARADNDEDPADFPEFVQPLVELEQCVPESYYVNMLAAYPEFRGQGVGSALMAVIERLAREAGCKLISIEVFAINTGALRLYERLGYKIVEERDMVASDYLPAGKVLLLTKPVA